MSSLVFTFLKSRSALSGISILGLALMGGDFANAETPTYPCEPPAAIKQTLYKISAQDDVRLSMEQRQEQKMALLRPLLSQYPNNLFAHRRYQDLARGAWGSDVEKVIEQYQAHLHKHPNDPTFLYLAGRLLIGRQTEAAKSYMEKAIQQAPNFPWAHLALTDIYLVPTYRDKPKAQTHLERFMALCPASFEGYSYVMRLEQPELMRKSAKNPDEFYSMPPASMQIAKLYATYSTRLDRVADLVQKGFTEVEQRAEQDRHRDWYTPEQRKNFQESVLYSHWTDWSLMVKSYLKANQRDQARDVLSEMEANLEKNKPEESAPQGLKRAYADRQATYWEWMGRWAEVGNRKLDALTFYQNAHTSLVDPEAKAKKDPDHNPVAEARRLWKELGGTTEGWQTWLARRNAAAPSPDLQGPLWNKEDKPLPDFELSDLQGRTWRLANLQGKATFINVWATWCGPCKMELPHVQKLHERLKGRPDVALVTLNIDTDVALVEPFIKKNGYTFPALLGYTYVEDFLKGAISIPRNWIVSRQGILRQQQTGFSPDTARWLEQALEAIEKAGE